MNKKSFELKLGPLRLVIFKGGSSFETWATLMVLFKGDIRVYRPVYHPKWTVNKWKRDALHALRFLQVWPVYVEVWSRDCDLCESTSAYKFPTYFHFNRFMVDVLKGAEGPMSFRLISKRQYVQFTPTFRDRVLEAFEDGRGNNVII